MNTKIKLFTIILLSAFTFGYAQNYKKNITTEFTEYLNTIVNKEFEKSMEYITPEFFDIVPKPQLIKLMHQTFNNPMMEIEIKNPKILEIEDVQIIENKYYALLSYSNQMNIKIKNEEDEEESEEDKKNRINMARMSFEQTFGPDNVYYNEKTEFFEIQSQKDVYGISENGETDWKFLVIEKKQKFILEKILPKDLTNKV